jgi:exopolysaccharide biosynthesis polyprenyl glycosylphosphotransferase
MLRQKARLVAYWFYFAEMALVIGAFYLAFRLRDFYLADSYGSLFSFEYYFWLIYAIIPIWSFLIYYFGLYESQRTTPFRIELRKIAKVSFWGTLLLAVIVFVFKATFISRLFIIFFGGISLVALVLERLFVRVVIRSFRRKGFNFRNILVVGSGRRAREFAQVVAQNRHWGLRLIGFVRDNAEFKPDKIMNVPVLGGVGDLPQMLQRYVVDELIFAVSRKRLEELEEIFLLCEEQGVRTRVAVNFFPHMIAKVHLDDFNGIPLLTFTTTPHNEALLMAKRLFDVAVSSLLLVVLLPLLAVIALLIKLSSPGPIFFRQTRVGLNGRLFTLYKFRSMMENAEGMRDRVVHLNEMAEPAFKIKNDPRATPVGRFLRRISLDEIPQLYNVLRGDMSIVGPRPPLPEEVEQYERWQRRRLSMKPGLTCLWQVNGRNKITDFKKWMELDLHYIDHWSLKLDMKIFLKTIVVVLVGRGAS